MAYFCWNCKTYDWNDDSASEEENFPQCKQCKVPRYCSRECQKEHWKKVHKKHCKYLAGKSGWNEWRHGENCRGCKNEIEASGSVKQVDNPVYPCYIKHSYEGTKKYFMARSPRRWSADWNKYISKLDKNIAIIQKIFIKLDHVYPNGQVYLNGLGPCPIKMHDSFHIDTKFTNSHTKYFFILFY